jgi:predicted thioredoxin/glutaredoxin
VAEDAHKDLLVCYSFYNYFLALCEKAGKMLTVPTILINGEVKFSTVPHPDELEAAIEAALARNGILQKK